ncbi:MAG TPA: hypothetical protein VK716_06670 [Terracidiphilus sp.]|nr:hypothetical protein [Terracidiphilus sp.]
MTRRDQPHRKGLTDCGRAKGYGIEQGLRHPGRIDQAQAISAVDDYGDWKS